MKYINYRILLSAAVLILGSGTLQAQIFNISWGGPAGDWSWDIPVVETSSGLYQLNLDPANPMVGVDENGVAFIENGNAEGMVRITETTLETNTIISYATAVTDLGAPSLFTFSFATPISVPAGPTLVSSSLTAGLTDAGADGATLSFFPGSSALQIAEADGTNLGVDLGSPLSAPPAGSDVGLFSEPLQPGPAGPFSLFEVTTKFSLSGSGDQAAFTGRAEIVPEPTTGFSMLCGAGLLVLGRMARRRCVRSS